MKSETKKSLNSLLENTGDMALKRRARRIIEEIDPKEGDKILEVGCGDGFYLHILSSLEIKNLKLTGVDIDKRALKSAKKNLKGRKIALKLGDVMEKLPFRANAFDKIIMSEVCEHLPDDVKGLKEVKRVMKKGGILIVTVPNHNYPLLWDPVNWTLEYLFNTHIEKGFWAGLWNNHLRLYKPKEIKKSVKKAGFNVKKVESMTYWCLPFNHNLMYFAARKLHDGELGEDIAKAISKYESKKPKRPPLIELAFKVVNETDKLNDIWQPKDRGVGVLVRARKQ